MLSCWKQLGNLSSLTRDIAGACSSEDFEGNIFWEDKNIVVNVLLIFSDNLLNKQRFKLLWHFEYIAKRVQCGKNVSLVWITRKYDELNLTNDKGFWLELLVNVQWQIPLKLAFAPKSGLFLYQWLVPKLRIEVIINNRKITLGR